MMSTRFFIAAIAVGATSILSMGCNSNGNSAPGQAPEQATQAKQTQTGPAWTLKLQSNCSSAAETQCLAKYGFSVDAAGKYRVGPGPQGQMRNGTLTDAEFAQLKTQIQTATAAAPSRTEGHDTNVENVSDDTLTLSHNSGVAQVVAHNTAGDFYFTTATADTAQSLHAAMRDLANSYYRLPFGDACGDAVDKFGAAAAQVTSCQVDTDCVYIDEYQGFTVIPPSIQQWILTEDCTSIQPPVVANKVAILGAAQGLMDLHVAARNVCGAEFSQSNFGRACSYLQKQTTTQPVCVQNRCQSKL